jgi:pimeloyl-ACP methyl ester carboxylesterase
MADGRQGGARGTSRTLDLGGPVHAVDYGGRADGPTIVLVHGLGGSHLNWDLFAPVLTPHARVHSLDLPGFGRSEPGMRQSTVPANVAVLDRFLREVAEEPVVLVGNSMGGMISILETAAAPALVQALVLLDPAVPGPKRSRWWPSPSLPGRCPVSGSNWCGAAGSGPARATRSWRCSSSAVSTPRPSPRTSSTGRCH